MGSNPALLANLEYDSVELLDLHKSFVASARNDLKVFNFYEERPVSIMTTLFFEWKAIVGLST